MFKLRVPEQDVVGVGAVRRPPRANRALLPVLGWSGAFVGGGFAAWLVSGVAGGAGPGLVGWLRLAGFCAVVVLAAGGGALAAVAVSRRFSGWSSARARFEPAAVRVALGVLRAVRPRRGGVRVMRQSLCALRGDMPDAGLHHAAAMAAEYGCHLACVGSPWDMVHLVAARPPSAIVAVALDDRVVRRLRRAYRRVPVVVVAHSAGTQLGYCCRDLRRAIERCKETYEAAPPPTVRRTR